VVEFVKFFFSIGVYFEDILARLFTLTLEGQAKKWCYSLLTASIHSFQQLVKELHKYFDRYEYQDVCKRINKLRMKLDEYLEEFSN